MGIIQRFNTQFKEILHDSELLFILAKRDISVRYKQTYLGVSWAIVRPVLTMLVFLFAFKNVAKIQDLSGYPIQLVIFSGILFWNLFATTFQSVSNSIISNGNLISKVYFPRLIICLSSMAVSLVDFFVGLIVYVILVFALGQSLSLHILYLPIALVLTLLTSLGFGILFASFSVKYRDLLQIIPLIVQYGFFVTPIVYTSQSLIGSKWYIYYSILNPLAGLVEFFRYGLLVEYRLFDIHILFISAASTIFLFLISLFVFHRREDSFVDHL
jgi:lipopolysaccharide transport system permease protein